METDRRKKKGAKHEKKEKSKKRKKKGEKDSIEKSHTRLKRFSCNDQVIA